MKESDIPIIYSDDKTVVYDVRDTPYSILNKTNRGYVLDKTIHFGRDYPSGTFEYDLYTIFKKLEKNHDLDYNLHHTFFRTTMVEDLLKNHIINEEYAERISENIKSDEIKKMNAPELSQLLKDNGINVAGKKKKLVKIALKNIESLNPNNAEYQLTQKGLEFIKEQNWIDIYDIALECFELNDFYKFHEENDFDTLEELGIAYIDCHIKNAHELKDYCYVMDCITSKKLIYNYTNNKEMLLKEELLQFIYTLNPIYEDYEEYFSNFERIKFEDIENIKKIVEELNIKNLKEIYSDVWDSIDLDEELINKNDSFRYLKRLFDNEKFDDLTSKVYLKNILHDRTVQTTLFDY